MIQPVLLLLLLASRSSPVLVTEVSVLEGSSVTLVCGSSVMDRSDICFLKVSTDGRPVTIQHLQHATSGYSLRNCSGKVTYSAKKYSLVLKEKNWTDAQEYCRQHYTNLSIIHTEEDWKAIQSTLGNFSGDAWIGLHRDKPDPDEKWKWSDGKDFMFFNWATGFGNHMGKDCVTSTSSHWQPADCGLLLQYVCQQLGHNENGKTEKKYELMSGSMQWKSALENCKTTGRVLASIYNQKEQDAFDEVAKNDHTWIGLKHENNTWNWSSGEPFKKWDNPMHVGDGNCVTLNSKNYRKWTPTNCSTQRIFLCYEDESPLNTTGDLTTPVTPETTTCISTGPPPTQMSTTRPTTLLHTTTNGQSTTSPTTTRNGQSTTSPTTTRNIQSTTSSTTTTNVQSTTSPTTTTNGQSATSPTTTTNGQSTTSPTTTTNGQSATSPTTTTNGQSTTSPTTTTNGQSTTSPTTTTNGQSATSPTTTTNGQSTTSPTTTTNGQSATSPTTTTNGQSTTS
uniref:C-type lectin domain-containing protein n=1 Tax=Hucho hucho TaxID=62062 RepID=A0A4W5QXJ1_9TELE